MAVDDKKEITDLILQQINLFDNYSFSTISDHTLFHQRILKYIHKLKKQGYHIKQIISGNHTFVDNKQIIEVMEKCINAIELYALDTKEFDLSIYEKENFLIFKLITVKVNDSFLHIDINKGEVIRKIVFIDNENNEVGIKILFNLDFEYDLQ